MEFFKSAGLFIFKTVTKIYWVLPTLVLDPFDLLKRIFNIDYQPPQWSIWLLFSLGCFTAMLLAYHELRIKNLQLSESSGNWIIDFEKTKKRLPIIDDYMVNLIVNGQKGQTVSKKMELTRPSVQYWSGLTEESREKFLQLVDWLGKTSRTQYLQDIEKGRPSKGYQGIIYNRERRP
jgi:hypothetical protein